MPPDDWRRRAPYFQEPNLGRNLALRDALRPIAQKHGVNVGAVGIAWTLASPGISGGAVARPQPPAGGRLDPGPSTPARRRGPRRDRPRDRANRRGLRAAAPRVSEPRDPFPAYYGALEAPERRGR